MNQKYMGKYRSASNRLAGYDYSQNGAYFVTICTKDKTHFFGTITDGAMTLSPLGTIAHNVWLDIPKYVVSVQLGESIIMPDHVHGVVMIENTASIPKVTVGMIVNQYKRRCTMKMRTINPSFAWQSRFYDRIIRNEDELNKVSEYIIHNPQNWNHED